MLEAMNRSYGHTFAELLIVLCLLTIMANIATPVLSRILEAQQRTTALNQMLGALVYSRSSAVFGRRSTVLCAGTGDCNGSTIWAQQLTIFHDLNANGRRDVGETLLRQELLPKEYSWHWASFRKLPHAIFEADGSTRAANGTLTLCKGEQPQKQIVINLVGRIRYQQPAPGATCH